MSRINMITVMLLFMQGMNLMTLFVSIPDFSNMNNLIKFFLPGALALLAFVFGQVTKPRA